MRNNLFILILISFSLQTCPCLSFAADKPEIVVRTGYAGSVSSLAINSSETYLASLERGSDYLLKIWEVSSGHELATAKISYREEPVFG